MEIKNNTVIYVKNGNKKEDNSPYCWITVARESRDGNGYEADKIFLRHHTDVELGDVVNVVCSFNNGRAFVEDVVRA